MSPELLPQIGAPAAIGLSVLALAGGAALARLSGPLSCTWPSMGGVLLRRLDAVRRYRPLSAARSLAGGAVVAALMAGGGLGAYAAAAPAPAPAPAVIASLAAAGAGGAPPSWSPAQLPAEVRGVVGSGERLGLEVLSNGVDRVVRPGEAYRDGWLLQGLTPTAATLSRGGQSVQIGLNPAGALPTSAAPAAGPDVSVLLSQDQRKRLEALMAVAAINPYRGLTPDQTARMSLDTARLSAAFQARRARPQGGAPYYGMSADEIRSVIGSAAFDELLGMSRTLIGQGQMPLPFTRPMMGIGYDVEPTGVLVTSVDPDGPATRAGLAAGDFIVKVNGEDAVTQTRRRETTEERISPDPLVYTLATGAVITVKPEGYFPY